MCKVKDCDSQNVARELCRKHYMRWSRNGDENLVKPRPGRRRVTAEVFWSLVDKKGPDDCWEWNAGRTDFGYGTVKFDAGPIKKSHQVSYFLANGSWAKNMVLHHCDNPPCCNPAHLYDGTAQQNSDDAVRRGRLNPYNGRADRTECPKGHKYTEENTGIRERNGKQHRFCRECGRIAQRNYLQRKKLQP